MHPITNDFVDTLRLSRRLLPELKHHRLSDLANYYNIDTTGSHRSLTDVRITIDIMYVCQFHFILLKQFQIFMFKIILT